MEVFDGFIAAIASEFKIKFQKDGEGAYTASMEFDNGRNQEVLVTLSKDESGDRIIHYLSIVGKLKTDSLELYKYALELNSTFDYGALVLMDSRLVLRNTILLHGCQPQNFMKSLIYIAAKADELEELLIKSDNR